MLFLNAFLFCFRELRSAASLAMAARADWLDEKAAKALTASFRLLNLVPDDNDKGLSLFLPFS